MWRVLIADAECVISMHTPKGSREYPLGPTSA